MRAVGIGKAPRVAAPLAKVVRAGESVRDSRQRRRAGRALEFAIRSSPEEAGPRVSRRRPLREAAPPKSDPVVAASGSRPSNPLGMFPRMAPAIVRRGRNALPAFLQRRLAGGVDRAGNAFLRGP